MRFNHDLVQGETTRLTVPELASQDVSLVADATWDTKSATDCVGASHQQYSGIKRPERSKVPGLCQVAVHLAAPPRRYVW
ncbi:hypothetical protein [Streptomyces hokutonensis]|uniref:hypothetical protein n=1 Tax=Streptomyces hokutonensis TaxID=1306990 RepID=UPI00381C66EA